MAPRRHLGEEEGEEVGHGAGELLGHRLLGGRVPEEARPPQRAERPPGGRGGGRGR